MLSEHFGCGQQTCLDHCWAHHRPLTLFDCVTCAIYSLYVRVRDKPAAWLVTVMSWKSHRGTGEAPSNSSLTLFEKVSFRATTLAPVIVRATFSWPIYLLFLFSSSGNCLKNVATDFFIPFLRLVAMKQSHATLKNTCFCTFWNNSES